MADKIKKIVAELDNYKTITNEQLRALLHPTFGKQVNKILTKVHKVAGSVYVIMELNKTDIIHVLTTQIKTSEPEIETIKELVFDNSIGGIKFEDNKFLINKKIEMIENTLIQIEQPPVNVITLKNEYDLEEIKQVLQTNDKTLILGTLPGTGKTTSAKNCGYKLLFVTPFNKLSQELRKDGYESVTLHRLLGMGITDEQTKTMSAMVVSEYEAICFDEIMLYNVNHLARIYRYIHAHKRIHFFRNR